MREWRNQAGRLLAEVTRLTNYTKDDDSTVQAYFAVFGITEDHCSSSLAPYYIGRHLIRLRELLDEVQGDVIRAKPHSYALYFRGFDKLMAALSPFTFDNPWKTVRTQYLESLVSLELCASELPEEREVPADELNAIRSATYSLFELIHSSEINKDLKIELESIVRKARDYIDNFQLYGSRAFRRMMKELAGVAAVAVVEAEPGAEGETARTSWCDIKSRFVALWAMLASAAQQYERVKPLIESGPSKLLLGKLLGGDDASSNP